jgi:hypothetical protein
MLQIDHVYEFFFQTIFTDEFDLYSLPNGSVIVDNPIRDDIHIFTPGRNSDKKIFFYDQEPFISDLAIPYVEVFNFPAGYNRSELIELRKNMPYGIPPSSADDMAYMDQHPECLWKTGILVTSEISNEVNSCNTEYNFLNLYYFFHGFAALDWYRSFYALNYNKPVVRDYEYDYVSFNRLVSNDRSYRCYFVSRLAEELLLEHGQVSFGLPTEQATWQEEISNPNTRLSPKAINHIQLHLPSTPLVIDREHVLGSASADSPRCVNDSFWHVVTETVFYYDKLHLTEKIFKPIVMKQPFMLLAAPGNLAYLKSYGFKTFEGIIDESYDTIQDPDARIDAVVEQLVWYCTLSPEGKQAIIAKIEPIVEYNFNHFYTTFKHIIARELITNCQELFEKLEYNDKNIAYEDIFKTLIN